VFGELTFEEISERLKQTSILCLPIGATEQHGPHLPLNTDAVIAEGIARRIIARWGADFDLWLLPTVSYSLSREHDWAAGTLSVTIGTFVALMKDLAREMVRAGPTANMLIVNGHGGNRGALENLIQELHSDLGVNVCVVHPFDLAGAAAPTDIDVHGGNSETSVMLELAPHLVRQHRMILPVPVSDKDAVAALIFDRGASFPWRTDDPRLATKGVIGEPSGASAQIGRDIIEAALTRMRGVLEHLLENQKHKLRRG
jgi:creatinine amidohydrolase/Fe(II)-dependent formamide hydrolase-like protein